MAFNLDFSQDASDTVDSLERGDKKKYKKVCRALQRLQEDPHQPSLRSKKFRGLEGQGPNGEDIWQSNIEHGTPGAWRIHWYHDKSEKDLIGVVWLGKHPD